jgi:heme/copper-type cytochrome/quinol oxidase subunit 1
VAFFIGIMFLIFFFSKSDLLFASETVDSYLHHTYYVITYFHFIVLVVWLAGTLFSIGVF